MTLSPGVTLAGPLRAILDGAGAEEDGPAPRDDDGWMRAALRRAMRTSGLSEPNPTVGCVIVKKGRRLADGSSLAAGGAHAERVAIDSVRDREALRGATLYVTLEPCSHHGRQPPCAGHILAAGIRRVVVGALDTDARVEGRGIARLRAAGVEVVTGVLRAECTAWHLPFLMRAHLGRPFVAAKWAQTLDGQLAFDDRQPQTITGSVAQRYTHWLRHRYDGILVGAGTAIHDLPSLTVRRLAFEKRRDPVRIVVDPSGWLARSRSWPALLESTFSEEAPCVLLTGGAGAEELPDLWERPHVHVARLGTRGTFPEEILRVLCDPGLRAALGRPLDSILLEGGPRLHAQFLAHDFADVAHVLVAPVLGAGEAFRIAPPGPERRRLETVSVHRLGADALIEMAGPDATQMLARGARPSRARAA